MTRWSAVNSEFGGVHAPCLTEARDPRTTIPPELYGRLVARIVREHDLTAEQADRIMSQTLAFLLACAANPGMIPAPSKTTDIVWHVFLLHTREYADFCQQAAGRFIHHTPDDDDGGDGRNDSEKSARIGRTLDAMRKAGLPVEVDLWLAPGKCSQCYAGCTSDPGR